MNTYLRGIAFIFSLVMLSLLFVMVTAQDDSPSESEPASGDFWEEKKDDVVATVASSNEAQQQANIQPDIAIE